MKKAIFAALLPCRLCGTTLAVRAETAFAPYVPFNLSVPYKPWLEPRLLFIFAETFQIPQLQLAFVDEHSYSSGCKPSWDGEHVVDDKSDPVADEIRSRIEDFREQGGEVHLRFQRRDDGRFDKSSGYCTAYTSQ
ncbi:MAG: hypothetical protein ACRYG5_08435 [Janthinobacterium lividum]